MEQAAEEDSEASTSAPLCMDRLSLLATKDRECAKETACASSLIFSLRLGAEARTGLGLILCLK